MGFAQIYTCSEHGETIHPVEYEMIDCENDNVEWFLLCDKPGCTREVKPLMHDGKPVLRPLTDEEMYWELSDFGDED